MNNSLKLVIKLIKEIRSIVNYLNNNNNSNYDFLLVYFRFWVRFWILKIIRCSLFWKGL